jgi:hypothetical protein
MGVSAKRAVAVKIETYEFVAIHTPETYIHLVVSKFPRGFLDFSTSKFRRIGAPSSTNSGYHAQGVDLAFASIRAIY